MITKSARADAPVQFSEPLIIGKDILELLSSSMYIDPLTVFREYVQNAADSIDEAESQELYSGKVQPRIEIQLDPLKRWARVRDNGIGVPARAAARRLTAFGASRKRGSAARGFRGVGRLAGLGYCQELIMRTRALGDTQVTELRWNCLRLKELLADSSYTNTLEETVRDVVTVQKLSTSEFPAHFFEVEMNGVMRFKNDLLLNEDEVSAYLSQVGPVPFRPGFSLGRKIEAFLEKHGVGKSYQIFVNSAPEPLYRPHDETFRFSQYDDDQFEDVEFFSLPSISDGDAAVGWILHHGYLGALPRNLGFRGLRLRKGNIQIGAENIFEDLFPEPRFNVWAVGEIHSISPKLIPNGRRDALEQNSHYLNLQSQLTPAARKIAKLCRSKSQERQRNMREAVETKIVTLSPEETTLLNRCPRSKAAAYRELIELIYELRGGSARKLVSDLLNRITNSGKTQGQEQAVQLDFSAG
ncbi:ATP-binding protein [Verrucomicrobiota bacterium sgz303538]